MKAMIARSVPGNVLATPGAMLGGGSAVQRKLALAASFLSGQSGVSKLTYSYAYFDGTVEIANLLDCRKIEPLC